MADAKGQTANAKTKRYLSAAAPPLLILLGQMIFFPMPIGAMLSGAVLGLAASLAAVGLALIWRANRVVNFAQGDLGAFPATLAVLLITLAGLPWILGLAVGLGAAVVVGVLADVLVVRRFARSPRLVLTVATLGLAQVLAFMSLLLPTFWGEGPAIRQVPPPFEFSMQVGGVGFNANDLLAVIVAPILLFAVSYLLRRTDTGTAVRASSERLDRAATLGVPVRKLETQVWTLATLLSFASVFLTAGISTLPFGIALGLSLLLRSLTAVIVGRMTHLVVIGATAVALGILESGIRWNTSDAAIMAPIMAGLVLISLLWFKTGQTRAEQDQTSSWQTASGSRALPEAVAKAPAVRAFKYVTFVAVVGAAIFAPVAMGTNGQVKMGAIAAFALIGVSVVVLTGWAGQISLGQMAFVGAGAAIGAYGMANHGWDPFLAVLIGGVVGAVVAVVVGLPALRVRGLYLAVVTLAIGIAFSEWVFSNRAADWIPEGSFARPALLHRIALESPLDRYWFSLGVLAIGIVALVGIRRSRTGRVLLAIRDNEPNTTAFGINPTVAKLTAFATSGMLAASAGVLMVVQQGAFRQASYAPEESLSVLVATVVGGIGSLAGGVIGAIFQRGSQWMLPAPWSILATGAGALIVLMIAPGGLAGWLISLRDKIAYRLAGVNPEELIAVHDRLDGDQHIVDLAAASNTPQPDAPESVPALLEVRDLRGGYGDLAVVDGVSLSVSPGEIVAILGGNGAGKTTLLSTVTGVLPAISGTVTLNGEDITSKRPDQIAAAGLASMPGGEGVFPGLSVRENLRVAGWLVSGEGLDVDERIDEVLADFAALVDRGEEPAANLSGGQQQMLALAMALMSQPKVLMIDELSLGLAPLIVTQLVELVRRVAANGTAVVLVEQSLNLAISIADQALFMEHGRIRFSGSAAEMAEHDELLKEIFLAADSATETAGSWPQAAARASGRAEPFGPEINGPTVVLDVHDLVRRFGGITAVSHVSFEVRDREIAGLIGQNGAGKTTVLDLICGYQAPDGGVVHVGGRDITNLSPPERFRTGLGRTFQGGALFGGLTVREAVAIGLEQSLISRGLLDAAFRLPYSVDSEALANGRVDELLYLFSLEPFQDHFVNDLSTGTRRIAELATAVAHQPKVLLLDEPAAGLAQAEVEALGALLLRIREELECSMLLIEHDMPLVASISDHLVALEMGSVISTGTPDVVLTDPLVIASYLGNDGPAVDRSNSLQTVGRNDQTGESS